MRRVAFAILMAAALAWMSGAALAASWEKVGTSGFTTAPSLLQDYKRIQFNSVVVDPAGNVFATANGSSYGLTIFKTNGSQVNVDLSTAGSPGPITKLVVGGDGNVYGVQNWLEINWDRPYPASGPPYIPSRILKITSAGVVSLIKEYSPVETAGSPPVWTNRIAGMTVGGDGNIYWAMTGNSNQSKNHYLWRYNVHAIPPVVEESPTVNQNQGWNENYRMFDLEYVGSEPITWPFPNDPLFAIVKRVFVYPNYTDAWQVDIMGWNLAHSDSVRDNVATPAPLGGHDWITAMAYDPVQGRERLWVGGRGDAVQPGPWEHLPTGVAGYSIIDLGSGNQGFQMTKAASSLHYWRINYPDTNPPDSMPPVAVTLGSRFRLDAHSSDYNGALLMIRLTPQVVGIYEPQVTLNVKPDAVNGDKYVLRDYYGTQLAELGPVVTGAFNTAYLSLDSTTDHLVCYWNGVVKYNGSVLPENYYGQGFTCFGAATRDATSTGTCTAVFDWVGYAPSAITPSDPWPTTTGYYLSGTGNPQTGTGNPDNYYTGCLYARFNGDKYDDEAVGLFNTNDETPPPDYKITSVYPVNDNVNGNNPRNAENGVWNGGQYWVSALAVDPVTGSAWMGVTGEATYDHEPAGTVMTDTGSEGVPEANAYTVGLTFKGDIAYALVCNKTTGAYSVYKAGPTPVAKMKTEQAGARVITDTPKVVTLTDRYGTFFYIEDDDRASGIKVFPPEGGDPAQVGDRALVKGHIDVKDGEAVIYADLITTTPTVDEIPPICTAIKNVGGARLGVQPPTYASDGSQTPMVAGNAYGLNTTGLLLRLVGKVSDAVSGTGFYLDDGSGYRVWVDYPEIDYDNGTILGVTGVSSVALDIASAKGARTILTSSLGAGIVTYLEP